MIPKNYVYMNGYCRSKSLPIETIKKILIHLGYIGENDVILPPGRMAGLTYHIDKYKNQKKKKFLMIVQIVKMQKLCI